MMEFGPIYFYHNKHWEIRQTKNILYTMSYYFYMHIKDQIYGLVQERCNWIANVLELHLSCTNPSI